MGTSLAAPQAGSASLISSPRAPSVSVGTEGSVWAVEIQGGH